MALNNPGSAANPFLRAADTEEIQASGQSMEDGFMDYLTTGTAGAATSAVVGIYNSVLSLGNEVGVVSDSGFNDMRASERNVIKNTFGQGSADFYDRHKEGVDAAGFAIGMIAPGMAGIKALRAAQVSGKLGASFELAGGLKNGDLVLGSKAVEAAKASVLGGTNYALNNPAVWRAFARGASQNAMEGVAFEVTALAANTQNASLNPEQLDYFDGFAIGLKGSFSGSWGLGLFAGGVVLGTGIDALRIHGAIKGAVRTEEDRTSHLRLLPNMPLLGLSAGDKAVFALKEYKEFRTNPLYAVDAADGFATRQKAVGESMRKSRMISIFTELNGANKDSLVHLDDILKAVDTFGEPEIEMLSGLTKIRNFNDKEVADMVGTVNKTVATFKVINLHQSFAKEFAALRSNPAYAANSDGSLMSAAEAVTRTGRIKDFEDQVKAIWDAAGVDGGQLVKSMRSFSAHFSEIRKALSADGTGGFALPINPNSPLTTAAKAIEKGTLNPAFFGENSSLMQQVLVDVMNGNPIIPTNYFVTKTGDMRPGLTLDKNLWLQNTNDFRAAFGLPSASLKDYDAGVFMHEMGHLKSNQPAFEDLLDVGKSGAGNAEQIALFDEAVTLSLMARPQNGSWGDDFAFNVLADLKDRGADLGTAQEIIDSVKRVVTAVQSSAMNKGLLAPIPENTRQNIIRYLLKPAELLADSSQMLMSRETREMAANLAPNLAKAFDNFGGLHKTWSPTKLYLNTRTGKTYTSWLPGVRDTGDIKLVQPKGSEGQITLKSGKVIKYDPTRFDLVAKLKQNPDFFKQGTDHFDYDAQWFIGQQDDLARYFDNSRDRLVFSELDLPHIERYVSQMGLDKMVPEHLTEIFLKDAKGNLRALSPDMAKEYLLQKKESLRHTMAITQQFNEQEIAKYLNISVDGALTGNLTPDDMLLYGKKDFSKPETFAMDYTPVASSDYRITAHGYNATVMRSEIQNNLRQQASAQIFGDKYNLFSEVNFQPQDLASISQTDSRRGLLTSARSDFGRAGEIFAYLGSLVRQLKNDRGQAIETAYTKYHGLLNHKDAMALRAELAVADNLIRRNRYYMVAAQDGKRYLVSKTWAADRKLDPGAMIKDTPNPDGTPSVFAELQGTAKNTADNDVVTLSDPIADFFDMHRTHNQSIITKKEAIAAAKGLPTTYDANILYPPPRNLKETPHIAFVVPTEFQAGADPRKYMVYGQTPAELEAKVASIASQHGKKYQVITPNDVEKFKKLQGEYDKNLVFDEIEFDSNIMRTGNAAELAPNMDLTISNTLDRYRNWTHKQEEYLINSGMELQYAGVVENLRAMDEGFGRFKDATIFGKEMKEQDTIYKYYERMMMDDKSYDGLGVHTWQRVNDYIGDRGSKILNAAFSKFGTASGKITQNQLELLNAHLEKQGYNPPFAKVMEAVLSSPDMEIKRTLPNLVRTLNNFAGAMQIRLDWANTIVQTMSTPILLSGVMQEARTALKGTANGAKLEGLLHVRNPAGSFNEPTSAKLMMRATQRFWSPEGKQFVAELQERGILPDYLKQYLEAMDFSELTGRHSMKQVNDVIDKMAKFGGKFTRHDFMESFTRYIVADSMRQVLEIRGVPKHEMWATIGSSVDKVHGIYRQTQRAQLFQGPVGQSIGLFQTYFFNYMQNIAKWVETGQSKSLAITSGLQSSVFGIQSLPGFTTFNQWIAQSNSANHDIYSLTNTSDQDPKKSDTQGWGHYFLYGLGSHVLGTPIDFASRGDMAIRNALIVPNPMDVTQYPALGIIAKGVSNIVDTVKLAATGMAGGGEQISTGNAIIHGIAHNGMNRPLQGLGAIAYGSITSNKATPYFQNSNYVDYDGLKELNWSGMFARALGTKPLNESILLNDMFRRKEYQANARRNVAALGEKIQLKLKTGEPLSGEDIDDFTAEYEAKGGDIENFNGYIAREMAKSEGSEVVKFRERITNKETVAGRTYRTMQADRSTTPPWEQ